jgi:F-type H+-transporting ATPase subunit b
MVRFRPTVLALLLALAFVTVAPTAAPAAKEEPAAGAAEKAKPATPNIFEPRLDLAIWTIIVFCVLLWVLKKLAWKPMLAGLQGREARIRGVLDEAQTARDEAQKIRSDLQMEMSKLHDKVREMMDEARKEGQQNKDRMVAEGRAEIQAEKDRARHEIQTEREQAVQELWSQTAQLATLVSAKVIGRSLNADDHRNLVNEAVAELRGAPVQKT